MLRSVIVVVACLATLACGSTSVVSSGTSASPSVPPSPSALGTPSASTSCPTAARVGAALGITLPKPTSVSGGTSTLPAGAVLIVCNYHASSYNVIIEVIQNIDPSYISKFSDRFPVAYKAVSGVGDQARTFYAPLSGGKNNEGVVATQGRTLVDITATDTPSTLAQLESLVRELL